MFDIEFFAAMFDHFGGAPGNDRQRDIGALQHAYAQPVVGVEAFEFLTENLSKIYELPEAQSVAKILFEDAFNIHDPSEDFMELKDLMKFSKYEARLMKNEPVQYVLGQADFYGLKLMVNSHVLIPRQETEELVFNIRKNIKQENINKKIKILDIGTGSGCIAIWLAKNIENVEVAGKQTN